MALATRSPSRSPAADQRTGMLAMILAMALLPVGDAISKTLTGVASPLEVTAWRALAQAAFFVPVALAFRRHIHGPVLSWPALVSALLILTVTLSLVTAFQSMPIATAIAIFFVEPLLLTLLAGPFLGEVPGPRRYAAVAVGLVGALIVIRPNFVTFGPVVLLPVLGALAYAVNMIVMRRATRRQSPLGFQFGASLLAGAVMLAALLLPGLTPAAAGAALPGWVLPLVILAGALATLAFGLITFAFSRAEASILAPFQYLEIVGAVLVGLVFFGELPDALTLLGAAIILASGAYVFHREHKNRVEAASAPARDR
jgi:drug/metabolite transporter (DMT)-like permease